MAAASAGLRGHRDAVLLRGVHQDDPIAIAHPVLRDRVDLGKRDGRQESPMQRVLVGNPRDRLGLREVADVLVGKRLRHVRVLIAHHLLEPARQVQLLPLELGGRKPEADDAVCFREERRQAFFDAVVGDQRLQ